MRPLAAILTCWIVASAASGQESREAFILEVNTDLVVRTVSVRDEEGRPIEGLGPSDFVVTEDGVRQTISVFEYQRIPEIAVVGPNRPFSSDTEPDEFASSDEGRRFLAFYFDFVGMAQLERIRTLDAALDFVRTRMAAADLVAIWTYTGGAVNLLRDFTGDRMELLGTLQRLRRARMDGDVVPTAWILNEDNVDIFATDRRLTALGTVAGALGRLRQAKSLIYFSSGVTLNIDNQAPLRATLNAAVRANVSIFPVDSRGLDAFAPLGSANQSSPGGIAAYTAASAIDMTNALQRSQDTLYTLGADTGGRAFLNSNDLVRGIVEAQRTTAAYYILGYYPTTTNQDGHQRRIQIDLRSQPGNVTYQDTYYAPKDFSQYTVADKERQLQEALLLGDPVTDFAIAMESHYFRVNETDYFIPLAVRIPGQEIALARTAQADSTLIDFVGEIRDDSESVVTTLRDRVEIDLTNLEETLLSSRPIQYDTGFTLRPGTYTLRFVARNAETGRMGTYQSVVAVPDLAGEAKQLPISSVVMGSQRVDLDVALFDADGEKTRDLQARHPLVQEGKKLIPNIRRVFPRGQPFYVYLEAYPDSPSSAESLVAFVSLYRENEIVFETPALVFSELGGRTSTAVPITITVPPNQLPPGGYTCQVSILNPNTHELAFRQTQVFIAP